MSIDPSNCQAQGYVFESLFWGRAACHRSACRQLHESLTVQALHCSGYETSFQQLDTCIYTLAAYLMVTMVNHMAGAVAVA